MAKIKSALELAMEKTEGIHSDKSQLLSKQAERDGRVCLVKVFAEETDPGKTFIQTADKLDKDQKKAFVAGGLAALLEQINIPSTEDSLSILPKITSTLLVFIKDKNAVTEIMSQVSSFLGQYLGNVQTVRQRLEEQFAPRLKAKEEEIQKKTGSKISLSINQDPEAMNYLTQSLNQLKARYQDALTEVKGELKRLSEES